MKKFLTLLSLSFLLFSCATKTPSVINPVATNQPPANGHDDNAIMAEKVSEDFVQGSEDIPLLLAMEKMFDEGLGFDSPAGSIMSSSYESKIGLEKVRSFYTKTLPQMGWKLVKKDAKKSVFKRENEKLEIEFCVQNNKNVVKFFISSAL